MRGLLRGKNVKPSINLILHALETDSSIGKEKIDKYREREIITVDSGTKQRFDGWKIFEEGNRKEEEKPRRVYRVERA